MAVPYTFGSATASIPLSQLDSNFATTITLGNTAIQLGNTVTTLNNMTLANVTISSGTSSLTSTSIANGTSNVTVNSSGGNITLGTAGTTAVTIDTSQNVGIGTTSPSQKLEVATASGGTIGLRYIGNSGYATVGTDSNNSLLFSIGNPPSEKMRINSSGNLLVGRTSGVASEKFSVLQSASDWCGQFVNSYSGTYYGIRINSSSTQNDTGSLLYDGLDGGNVRFRVYSNGGIANYSANNSNLSDQQEKKDIELAPNYLGKICAIPVKTFLYNDQTDTDKNLGAIAQDVKAVCPELVTESNWGTEEEPKMRLSIYQTDLQYALMKSIQELKAINDTQAATITALTARIVALEAK